MKYVFGFSTYTKKEIKTYLYSIGLDFNINKKGKFVITDCTNISNYKNCEVLCVIDNPLNLAKYNIPILDVQDFKDPVITNFNFNKFNYKKYKCKVSVVKINFIRLLIDSFKDSILQQFNSFIYSLKNKPHRERFKKHLIHYLFGKYSRSRFNTSVKTLVPKKGESRNLYNQLMSFIDSDKGQELMNDLKTNKNTFDIKYLKALYRRLNCK